MSEITTVAELDALPVGTWVADRNEPDGDQPWRKLASGRWAYGDRDARGSAAAHLVQLWGPLRVVPEPDDDGGTHGPSACGPCEDNAVDLAQDRGAP